MITQPQELAKAGFASATVVAKTAFDSFESLVALNMSATRSLVEASFANVSKLFGTTDIKAFVQVQQELAMPAIEKGVDYSRNVLAITTETKDKIAKEVETQFASANANVVDLVEQALAAAPAGSEAAVAAVKSAMNVASEAYEGINKAVKQVADVTEANVVAATEATLKAANFAAPKAAPRAARKAA
jgi:phasin family protein